MRLKNNNSCQKICLSSTLYVIRWFVSVTWESWLFPSLEISPSNHKDLSFKILSLSFRYWFLVHPNFDHLQSFPNIEEKKLFEIVMIISKNWTIIRTFDIILAIDVTDTRSNCPFNFSLFWVKIWSVKKSILFSLIPIVIVIITIVWSYLTKEKQLAI